MRGWHLATWQQLEFRKGGGGSGGAGRGGGGGGGGSSQVYEGDLDKLAKTIEIDTGIEGFLGDPLTAELAFSRKNLSDGAIGTTDNTANKQYLQVDFQVAGTFAAGDLNPRDALKVALKVRSEFNKQFAKMPDGTILKASPYTGDGKGAGRTRVYEKAGFGKPDSAGILFSVVRNGKPTPVTKSELQDLVKPQK